MLILDCVDGQLARAKECVSEWGRLLDGVAGYIIYLAVLIGIMLGLGQHFTVLTVIGVLTILRAISYDYCKLTMITMIQKGYDGNEREVSDTYVKILNKPSGLLKIYFYYSSASTKNIYRQFTSLHQFGKKIDADNKTGLLTPEQREGYFSWVPTDDFILHMRSQHSLPKDPYAQVGRFSYEPESGEFFNGAA